MFFLHLLHTTGSSMKAFILCTQFWFFSSRPNGMKNIIARCSHLNFLDNWIYCLEFSYVWLLIQRRTLAVQCWKRQKPLTRLGSCWADNVAVNATRPRQTGRLGRFHSGTPFCPQEDWYQAPKCQQKKGQSSIAKMLTLLLIAGC